MNTLCLGGCTSEPLGAYLRALAVLRLVGEQADEEARGWWDAAGFVIESTLDADELVEFFLRRYRPTPVTAPWNGGSGFYSKDRKVGLSAIVNSQDSRFAGYRETISIIQSMPEIAGGKAEDKAEEDDRRSAILRSCRNRLPDEAVDWLDAAVGISAEGERAFAPILGTGGNEGRLDYTNNFMERLTGLLTSPDADVPVSDLLKNALWGTATDGFEPGAVGQYDPGRAGGFNQGQGVETKDFPSNPWSFVLAIEGAVAWAAGLYRRQGIGYRSFLCSPFTVRGTGVGYGSASAKDGTPAVTRAEVWTPLWQRPATYFEIRAMLREGRASVEGRPAQNGIEFAEAACSLGLDRGISGFVRYNLLKRRGDSYVALPAGRFEVPEGGRWESDLARQLGPVLDEIDGEVQRPPAGAEGLRRRVDESLFSLLARGGPDALVDTLAAVGRLNQQLLLLGKLGRQAKRLTTDWVKAIWDSPEARIAAAVASIWSPETGEFRNHLDRNYQDKLGRTYFSWTGATLREKMTRTLEKRILLTEAFGSDGNLLAAKCRAEAQDVVAYLEGQLDEERIEELIFGMALIDWRGWTPKTDQMNQDIAIWPVYALLKHLFFSNEVRTAGGAHIRGDLGVLAALRAGRVNDAARIALRRLRNAGLSPVEGRYEGGFEGMALAAALLIPVPYLPVARAAMLLQEETK